MARAQQLIRSILTELDPADTAPSSDRSRPGDLHPEVVRPLRDGRQIHAIKRQREITGAGLAEIKRRIDVEINHHQP